MDFYRTASEEHETNNKGCCTSSGGTGEENAANDQDLESNTEKRKQDEISKEDLVEILIHFLDSSLPHFSASDMVALACLIYKAQEGDQGIRLPASGLKWRNIGETTPSQGQELYTPELAIALTTKSTFTQQEWEVFGICDLKMSQFVRSGGTYFRPTYFKIDLETFKSKVFAHHKALFLVTLHSLFVTLSTIRFPVKSSKRIVHSVYFLELLNV